jgi:dephospho-CoA kinase
MKIVGLTGGIGSGKSEVSQVFKNKGIPVYDSDSRAKILMNTHDDIKRKVIESFGDQSYSEGSLNRVFLASVVFSNPSQLAQLNAIIHPFVRSEFHQWVLQQTSSYVIQEAAILFETGFYKQCDRMILVTAPKEIRIQRVVERDAVKPSAVLSRIQQQWEDSKKIDLADFVIQNLDWEDTKLQIETIHQSLMKDFQ